jgi:putative endonuclease
LSFHVYVLVNDAARRRYVGQTDNLARRLLQHNGLSDNPHRYTRKFPGVWRLIHTEEYASRAEAMRREKWLKSGIGRAWLDEQFGRTEEKRVRTIFVA